MKLHKTIPLEVLVVQAQRSRSAKARRLIISPIEFLLTTVRKRGKIPSMELCNGIGLAFLGLSWLQSHYPGGKYDEVVILREILSTKEIADIMVMGVLRFIAVDAADRLTATWGMTEPYYAQRINLTLSH